MGKNLQLSNGVNMPRLGLGVDTLHGKECINSVIHAIEYGYRMIDTASCYNNEKEVGKAISECIKAGIVKREDLFITSKAPYHIPGYKETIEGYEHSLQNLGLDYLDLYLIHSPYWNSFSWKSDIIYTWEGMIELYTEKRVRSIGVANFNSGLSKDVMATSGLMLPHINQFEIHPQHQNKETVSWCKKHNIQPQAWGTLNQGRLFDSKILKEIADKYNKSVPQIAIRWNIQKGDSALVRSTKEERIKSNFDIWDFELSENDMQLIDSLDGGEWSHIHDSYEDELIAFEPRKGYWEKMRSLTPKQSAAYTESYKLFGFLPFMKKYKKNRRITKYYLFGIPIVKTDKKIIDMPKDKQTKTLAGVESNPANPQK